MAKSKNHTSHNDHRKDHRNGIKKPKRYLKPSLKGMYRPFLKNLKFAKKYNDKKRVVKQVTAKKAPPTKKTETKKAVKK